MRHEMTPEQHNELLDRLSRIEGEVEMVATKNGEGRFWKALQVGTSVLLCIVSVIVIPFGVWVTQAVHSSELRLTELEGWKAQGPRFTSVDAERLRLQIKDEVRSEIEPKLDKIVTILNEVRLDVKTHLNETKRP